MSTMPRCQICNRLLSDTEIKWNAKAQEWDFVCNTCMNEVRTLLYDEEKEFEEDAKYRDGPCPMDR